MNESIDTVCVIGLGYVGLPLCVAFAEAGVLTYGIDNDINKIKILSSGQSYLKHIKCDVINKIIKLSKFIPSSDFKVVAKADAVVICVPTPLDSNNVPDLSYIRNAANSISQYMKPGQVVILESTTYPGTTKGILRDILEKNTNLIAGKDFHIAFAPERENPGGNIKLIDIPKVIGGLTKECQDKACLVYDKIIKKIIRVSSSDVAEAAKLTENIFRSVNIALINELKMVYDSMGIDIWEVIYAASTKPFGFMPFYPGPGVGGHCIPVDPEYLIWKANQRGLETKLIKTAIDINNSMPNYVFKKIKIILDNIKILINKSRILLLGVAYKADIEDHRESPTYKIIDLLIQAEASVFYNDPHVPKIRINKNIELKSVCISNNYDLIVICTDHKEYNDIDFQELNIPIVDCRNIVNKKPDIYLKA